MALAAAHLLRVSVIFASRALSGMAAGYLRTEAFFPGGLSGGLALFDGRSRVLAKWIPELIRAEPPASSAQLDTLACALGLELPDDYRALLRQADGVLANLVVIYPAQDVPERNSTFAVAASAPGYFLIGCVNDFPLLLRAGRASPVFENDWGDLTPGCMYQVGTSLAEWIRRGCPGRGSS